MICHTTYITDGQTDHQADGVPGRNKCDGHEQGGEEKTGRKNGVNFAQDAQQSSYSSQQHQFVCGRLMSYPTQKRLLTETCGPQVEAR